MRLNQETVALLRKLDNEGGLVPQVLTDAPKMMFDLHLVSRQGSGALQLTRTGARALFQAECIAALEHAVDGLAPPMASGVERWLTSSGFLHGVHKTVTARGKLWLASLTPQAALVGATLAEPAATAGNCTARRDAA
ncbi:hypothetical protein [Massilia sp. DWR3-1-1]|uniref:hypothetical protein n=1 Tax=Massilia sp. DWR3-1-1 TaxID=2804559 RepID=UPI003CEC2D61